MRPEKSTSGSREERLSPGNKGKSQGLRKPSAPDVSTACGTWDAGENKIYKCNQGTCTHIDRSEMLAGTRRRTDVVSMCFGVFIGVNYSFDSKLKYFQ